MEAAGTPLERAEVTISLTGKHNRQGDADNVAGSILDALVQARVLVDDNMKRVPSLTIALDWKKKVEPKGCSCFKYWESRGMKLKAPASALEKIQVLYQDDLQTTGILTAARFTGIRVEGERLELMINGEWCPLPSHRLRDERAKKL